MSKQKEQRAEAKKIKRDEEVYYFEIFFKVINRYFKKLVRWMQKLEDFRVENRCRYPIEYMLFAGIMLYVLKRKYIRGWHDLTGKTIIENLNQYLKLSLETICHFTTLIYFFQGLGVKNLEKLRHKIIYKLIRSKVLTKYRIFGKYYLIAIDGSNNLTFKYRHCDKCIGRKVSNGEIYYYHPVLEAKIVTSNGLALSIGSEFIENDKRWEEIQSEEQRQDCELKASYRLIEKIKKMYPQLKICILADSLYANQQIMQRCKEYGWKYIITFKKGSIPNEYKEYEALKGLTSENEKEVKREEVEQKFHWVNDIEHEGHNVNVIECNEKKKKEQTEKRFVFITNILITKKVVDYIARNGRMRWKIENEGFNVQKNDGYNLEHKFSRIEDNTAIKNFYLLMQIAHIFNQLVEKSNLLKPYKDYYFKTIKNLSERLTYELVLIKIDFEKILNRTDYYITLDDG